MSLPDWSRAYGEPLFAARIRSQPADFDVTEELGFELSGDGEHDYLFIEKTSANTDWVLRQLAAHAGVPAKDVGCAGLKDRHAVTRQWFSVPRWHAPDWEQLDIDGVRLLEQQRHSRKLRRGAHTANRFRILLRGTLPEAGSLDARLKTIAAQGVPNYFGEQRFGRGGSNIALADAWSAGKRLPRHKRSLAISTARSFLFNSILDARVREETWDKLLAHDVANLDGTGSVFDVTALDDDLGRRCDEMDIHPAGPLCGEGTPPAVVPGGHENWLAALQNARVKAAYRSLRLRVADFAWSTGEESLELRFALRRGAFATAVLREIAQLKDATR
ncbi:MAG: tRNA pseudouridine(13) synthase TruD [Gammaproteobacteria bacterium]|nr:tRNA pseudouridine(13) synthase TruD [Gammaproteobacteria bacterium]